MEEAMSLNSIRGPGMILLFTNQLSTSFKQKLTFLVVMACE
jgi:hypothetical protein